MTREQRASRSRKRWYRDSSLVIPAAATILAAIIGAVAVLIVVSLQRPNSDGASIAGKIGEVNSEGQHIAVEGSGFNADNAVRLNVDGQFPWTAIVHDGVFVSDRVIPVPLELGRHSFTAVGQQSGKTVYAIVDLKSS